MSFTTRPVVEGTFGVATSTHWIASAVGMKLLEQGGTAYDAAVAMGFTLNVVEPHLNGPLGEVPALVWPAGADTPKVICGQGTAPSAATIGHYRREGLALIPGSGLLSAVVPGAFDAWMVMLRDYGRLTLRDVLEPAIHYAESGHPLLPRVAHTIAAQAEFFAREWPTSAETWLPSGTPPAPGALFRNPALAAFWRQLLETAESAKGRDAQIEAARAAFYKGHAAERIDAFLTGAEVMDGTGVRRKGVLTGQDMANWEACIEPAVSADYAGWRVWKAAPWTQGPVLLQALGILDAAGFGAPGQSVPDFVHFTVEALKLAFADREAYFGDPLHSDIPLDRLLSRTYLDGRAALIGTEASFETRPGQIAGLEALAKAALDRAMVTHAEDQGVGGGEPTMSHLVNRAGDTVHLDVVDRWGNMVAATPSGGWLQSNPVVPGIGAPLSTRAQMFWLADGLPTSLAPGRRPRTTLSPTMARRPDGGRLAFGTPGGDQQEQWQLAFLLRLVHQGLNLQAAIDAPLFHTAHLQASFYPRGIRLGHLMIEPAFDEGTTAELRARGHNVEVAEPWTIGRLTAAERTPEGLLRGAATPRLMQAYAAGR